MAALLTTRELDAIRWVAAQALAGPWQAVGTSLYVGDHKVADLRGAPETAFFLARAREDMLKLLGHAQVLEAEVNRLLSENEELRGKFKTLADAVKAIELPPQEETTPHDDAGGDESV